ncbi:hypothetical protein ISN45_At03g019630 [Arabidopsis thaliana x Arabidopsis arenosa]|uniref:Uncharacterized protein n=1 Tax=Arabidopsis thaliana x Arabidopsis arenosa TaxID=1240361 RepID=A0A8T2ENH9_9BRAS|nr:hypothetical protein ISN45_At03g019630 [Arabidopsis thaliana x Arabidopsis arenosa]KAG7625745.1 hypothetical protein ISN45_At03g019630 [Arabidopsis thaliana x Arabidopsis arenosa]
MENCTYQFVAIISDYDLVQHFRMGSLIFREIVKDGDTYQAMYQVDRLQLLSVEMTISIVSLGCEYCKEVEIQIILMNV